MMNERLSVLDYDTKDWRGGGKGDVRSLKPDGKKEAHGMSVSRSHTDTKLLQPGGGSSCMTAQTDCMVCQRFSLKTVASNRVMASDLNDKTALALHLRMHDWHQSPMKVQLAAAAAAAAAGKKLQCGEALTSVALAMPEHSSSRTDAPSSTAGMLERRHCCWFLSAPTSAIDERPMVNTSSSSA